MTPPQLTIVTSTDWHDYELLDSGNLKKLERFGEFRFIRPEPQAMWQPRLDADAWVADVKGAFNQGLKQQRAQSLFALPPPGGIPGESEDILIELLAEVYGLVTGPPSWRKSLLTKFKALDFKRHPLAPWVALM